ncbi:hypothetical protein AWB79_01261 [Caballeronia hypogeia]|uniref:Uncharacterized protein n=1 Tax=Caballeronia hypogeia TaxID=1777140 RepID=A0A157ZRP6_9BURK|nr:hypothetical protein [Caballeronia hypogeia]SAK48188.1 hypothetical protein AWB79_01261 [Caballeronia hypogeia]
MSITLNDLLEWRDRLPEQSEEEAHMVRALLARREAELRARIADLIAAMSQRENWKLQRCAAIARHVEGTSVEHLESVYDFFHNRSEGVQGFETPAILRDYFESVIPAPGAEPAEAIRNALPAPIVDLYGAMGTLESRVSTTPGLACGIQGIRIMRMVALMSKARSAQMEKMRMSGTQAFYRHS